MSVGVAGWDYCRDPSFHMTKKLGTYVVDRMQARCGFARNLIYIVCRHQLTGAQAQRIRHCIAGIVRPGS